MRGDSSTRVRTDPPLTPNGWLRWEIVSRRLPPDARDVLEIGCGQGGFAVRLARRYRYVGIEPDARSFAIASARLAQLGGGARIYNGGTSLLEDGEEFDFVCAFEVIEHIDDDRGALLDWIRRLRPGGSLMLSAPAWQRRFAASDEMVGHCRRYDPGALEKLLLDVGLVDVEIHQFGAPLGYALEGIRNWIGRRARKRLHGRTREDRSASSGRLLHPRDAITGTAVYLAVLPFRKLQHLFPGRGPGVLAIGRRVSDEEQPPNEVRS